MSSRCSGCSRFVPAGDQRCVDCEAQVQQVAADVMAVVEAHVRVAGFPKRMLDTCSCGWKGLPHGDHVQLALAQFFLLGAPETVEVPPQALSSAGVLPDPPVGLSEPRRGISSDGSDL